MATIIAVAAITIAAAVTHVDAIIIVVDAIHADVLTESFNKLKFKNKK